MYGFNLALVSNPGPNVVSNPETTGGTGVLFRIAMSGEFKELLPWLEEQYPDRVTHDPDGTYSIQGFVDASLPEPVGGLGAASVYDVDAGLLSVSVESFYIAIVRGVYLDGASVGNFVQVSYAMSALRVDDTKVVKVTKVEVEGGYVFDYDEEPILPDPDDGGRFTDSVSSTGFDDTYIPIPSCIVTIYGVIEEDTSPVDPVAAMPGGIFPGFGLVTDKGNYIRQGVSYAQTYKLHPSELRVQYSLIHEVTGTVDTSLVGQFLLTPAGSLSFEDDFSSNIPVVVATNVKSISPAYPLMQMSDNLFDVDNMCAIFIVKNDNKLSWWGKDINPYLTGIDNIPASLAAGSEAIRCVRYSGVRFVTCLPEQASTGMIFGALTTAGDLYIWGRQAVELGFATTPLNIPGAIDFVILMQPTPHLLVLTDQGYCFEIAPDWASTAVGGGVVRMNKKVAEYQGVNFIMGDGKLKAGSNPLTAVYVKLTSDTAFPSETLVLTNGFVQNYYNGDGDPPFQFQTRYAEVKAPPDITLMYPGRTIYDTTTSPVPGKYRRSGGMGAAGGYGMAYIDTTGRVRRVAFDTPLDTAVYNDSISTEGAVDFDKLSDRNTAVLDVYGDVYDGGGTTRQAWDKVPIFSVKVKAIYSAKSSFPGVNVVGLGLDNKLVVPPDATYTLPAHQVGKVMRFMGKMTRLNAGYSSITEDGELYFSGWNFDGTPEYTGKDAVEFWPIQMCILDPATQLPVSQTEGGWETSLIRNPDGTISELQRKPGAGTGSFFTNATAGLNISDVKRIESARGEGFAVQLSSDPKKLRYRSYGFVSGPGGVTKVKLTKWFDITLPVVPIDWWIHSAQTIASEAYDFTICYTRTDGSVWYYKVIWPSIDNEATFTVDHALLIPTGEVRTDIKTIGAPPVTGGWGINWGNNFGG